MRARPGRRPLSAPRFRRSPYLVTELVAGEAEDLEPAGAVALLQLIELQEIALGRASERRHIGHQQHLALQRAQGQRLRRAQGPRRQPRQPRHTPGRSRCRHGAHCPPSGPAPAPVPAAAPRPAPSRPVPPRSAPPGAASTPPRAAARRSPALSARASPPNGPPAPPGLGPGWL